MRKPLIALPVLVALTACGDPLSGIERVSELPEGLPETTSAAALPSEAEINNREPIFSGLFRRNTSRPDPAVEAAVSEAVTGEGPEVAAPVVDAAVLPAQAPVEGLEDTVDAVSPDTAAVAPADPVVAAPASAPERGGVFTWLRRAGAVPVSAPVEDAVVQPEGAEGVTPEAAAPLVVVEKEKVASLAPIAEPAVAPVVAPEPQKRRGLFGRRNPATTSGPRNGPDAQDVAVGTVLPFGEIARVCDARPGRLAKIVERAAGKGSDYVLFDSAPDTASPRTFYVTGFSDNCPRQFTASLALFGTPQLHEQLRYGLPAKEYPYSTTDEAYEKVKGKICNVGRTKPCGTRIRRLEDTTVFVSAYENFGENARWADLLLHDGALLAAALKAP